LRPKIPLMPSLILFSRTLTPTRFT
jgi:hypothetical protein